MNNQDQKRFFMDQVKQANFETIEKNNSTKGFASMDPERLRQVSSEGGKASYQKRTAGKTSK